MWDKARLITYVTGFLIGVAGLASAYGWGTYDSTSMMFDPPPVHVGLLATLLVSAGSPLLAAMALFKGWGRR